jgi:serine phosphatase RsbU (regulator of sigma subunit)
VEEVGQEIAGLPVGVDETHAYGQATVRLGPGEMVILYTDGISEAMDPAGKLYTISRIRERVRQTAENADTLGKNILDDVRAFIGGRTQGDDMCLVSFSRNWPVPAGAHAGATAVMK